MMFAAGDLLLSEECVAAMVYRDADPACCSACVEPLELKKEVKCEGCNVERYCSEACRYSSGRAYHSSEGECAAFEAALEAEEAGRREAAEEATTSMTSTGERAFDFQDVPQRFLVRVLSQAGKWRGPSEPLTCADVDAILALEAHVPHLDSPEHAWLCAISRNTLRLMDASVDEGLASRPAATAIHGAGAAGEGRGRQPRKGNVSREGEMSTHAAARHYGVPQLTRLMCCVNCNSHTLYAREKWPLEPSGTAVYLHGSAFNHSCRPTAEFYNVGTSLRVRSVRPIGSGEEVTVSYVPLTHSLADRRRSLANQYKFTCACERCQEEEQEVHQQEEKRRGGLATKRVKLNEDDDACLSDGDDELLRRGFRAVLDHLKTTLSQELTSRTGGDTAAEYENARRAATAVREVCDLHVDALVKLKCGSEPALRMLHIVRRLDDSLSTPLSREITVATAIERVKVVLLKQALGLAVVARGEDHPFCVEIGAALSAMVCDKRR